MEDSVGFDEYGRVYIRPTHYAGSVALEPGAVAPKVYTEARFCVMCGKKLSMYNNGKNGLCYSLTCEKKFQDTKKKKKK